MQGPIISKGFGDVAQVAERLPSKQKALSSNTNTTKKIKIKTKRKY
jgi:hypothetical protein